ncbi:MAG: helix-turn-helix domain-containing protein [Leptospiraceae bacterium]|nr:helix-turn-helix domain-containing protein [Leptospiraceae bacterium]MCP5502641.1 helix-turn-helix domain-containing protein [Leptospiraceae bacterium]
MQTKRKKDDSAQVLWLFPGMERDPEKQKPKKEIDPTEFDLNPKEAARLLGVAERTLRNYRIERRIASIRVSPHKYRFSSKDLKHYLSLNYKPALYFE